MKPKDASNLGDEVWCFIGLYLSAHDSVYLSLTSHRFGALWNNKMGVSASEDVARLHQMWELELMFLGIHCQPNVCICGEIYCGLKEKEIQDNMIREEGEKERNRANDGHEYNSLVRLQLELEEEAESSDVPDYGDYPSEWNDEFYHT